MQTKKTMLSMAIFTMIFFLAATFDLSTSKKINSTDSDTPEVVSVLNEPMVPEDISPMNSVVADLFTLYSAYSVKEDNISTDPIEFQMANVDEITSFHADAIDPIEVEEKLADSGDLISMEEFKLLNEDAKETEEKNISIATDQEEAKEESLYSNVGISIAKDYVNIRKSANADSEILGKLYRDSAAFILKTEGDWCYVESGSVVGYIKSEFLKTGLSDNELIENYGTQKIRVTTDGLNVRKEPDQESDRLTCVYLGEVYPVEDIKDEWVKINVEDDNVVGYVAKEYVDVAVRFTTAVSKKEEAEKARIEAEKRAAKETSVIYSNGVSYSKEDLKLLAALVHAEAGGQCYEGKLAVANVVLNRVKSSKYPNSISKVIYQSGQFTVASSGSLAKQLANYDNYNSQSQKLTIKAAKAALEGANNIGNRLYFNSYKTSAKKGYLEKYPNSVKIEDHLFW